MKYVVMVYWKDGGVDNYLMHDRLERDDFFKQLHHSKDVLEVQYCKVYKDGSRSCMMYKEV